MVDEDTGQLAADGFGDEGCCDRAVDTAGKGQDDFAVADGFFDIGNSRLGIVGHGPRTGTAADFKEEVMEHFLAVFRMEHFRMVLHGIELLSRVLHGSDRAVGRVGYDFKAFRDGSDVVLMAHPDDFFFLQAFEQRRSRIDIDFGLAEFAHVSVFDFAA